MNAIRIDSEATQSDGIWVEVYPDTGRVKVPLQERTPAGAAGRSYKQFESRAAALEAGLRAEHERSEDGHSPPVGACPECPDAAAAEWRTRR